MTPPGLVIHQSRFSPEETLSRLETAVKARGAAVLARIDHAAAAEKAGLALRPTTVVIFGNPRAGTPLMQAVQTAGIDLPLKALVWQDEAGGVWLGYNDPAWIAERHGASGVAAVDGMKAGLAAIAAEATGG